MSKLEIYPSRRFEKELTKAGKKLKFKDKKELFDVIALLEAQKTLPKKYKDHSLKGNWKGYRECHIKPDLLLIYRTTATELQLMRLGSHSELFQK